MSEEKKEEVEQEVKDFINSLIENIADEMHYYIYETIGAEYDPIIRENQNKIKELETRINNIKNVMENIESDDKFKDFIAHHSKFFTTACMFSYATGLPIDYSVKLFEEDGTLAMEDKDDH